MPASTYTFDRSLHPLVVGRFRGVATNDDYDAFMRALNAELALRRPFVHVLDASEQVGGADAMQRRRLASWVQDERLRDLSKHKLGDAIIMRSALVRGAFTAVNWVMPPPSPTKAFERISDAEGFLVERCRAGGITLSEAAIRFLRADGRVP